jgi:hypothetical protein
VDYKFAKLTALLTGSLLPVFLYFPVYADAAGVGQVENFVKSLVTASGI